MQVVLDDTPCTIAGESVVRAIQRVAVEADRNGRVIIDIFIDGSRASLDEARAMDDTQASTVEELRLVSADRSEIVADAFATAEASLADIDRLQRTAAELLQSGEQVEAYRNLAEAIAMWSTVQQTVAQGTELAGLDLGEVTVNAAEAPAVIERLSGHLRAMCSSLETRDVVSLADTLLYEMPEVLGQWQDMLAALHHRVRVKQ